MSMSTWQSISAVLGRRAPGFRTGTQESLCHLPRLSGLEPRSYAAFVSLSGDDDDDGGGGDGDDDDSDVNGGDVECSPGLAIVPC